MAGTVHCTARQFEGLLRKRLQADTQLLERAALETAARGVGEAVRLTDEDDLVDRGQYRQSWKFMPIPGVGAELRDDAPHAAGLEYGTRPHRAPVGPILGWVKRKLVGQGIVAEKDAYGVALAICNSIEKNGTRPHFVLRRVVAQMGPWFRTAAIRELRRQSK